MEKEEWMGRGIVGKEQGTEGKEGGNQLVCEINEENIKNEIQTSGGF